LTGSDAGIGPAATGWDGFDASKFPPVVGCAFNA
jgi:hypothetical protein